MNFSKYESTIRYPIQPTKPRLNSSSPTKAEMHIYLTELQKYEIEQTKFKKQKEEYYNEQKLLNEQFWIDTFQEANINPTHPKASKLKELAYAYGHSSGYSEIFNYFLEFSELLS